MMLIKGVVTLTEQSAAHLTRPNWGLSCEFNLHRLYLEARGAPSMDRITAALLNDFSRDFGISDLPEDERFEHFAAWLTARRHYSDSTFDPENLVTGKGNDTGIDSIAVIVNNNLVTDVGTIEDLLAVNGYLDVAFIFVQAERSAHFESAKIGSFAFGVRDFFGDGKLRRNETVQQYAEIMAALYSHSSKFRPKKPACYLYYVTTGTWNNDADLVARAETETNELRRSQLFERVDFVPIGADQISKLYQQSKNTITREFVFDRRVAVPELNDVKEAHLGFLSAKGFLRLIRDENGEIIKSLFIENIRDWVGYNQINSEIKDTLGSEAKSRFILMNNGVTLIARTIGQVGDKFTISDFQVVNGCQTSHVLHDNESLLSDSVRIPFRLIGTQDESVIEDIIRATNRQTEVKDDQFFAMKNFAKKLEAFFKAFPEVGKRLYYERRAHQYDSQEIEKSRIIVHQHLVRAFGAMFIGEPHVTIRNFRALNTNVGKNIFVDTDKLEPYYVAAYALYRLEQLFKNKTIDGKYKVARYQILLSVRLFMDDASIPPLNSGKIADRCTAMMDKLWNEEQGEKLFTDAVALIDKVAGDGWNRDLIHTEGITK